MTEPVKKFDIQVSLFWKLYAFLHANLVMGIIAELAEGLQVSNIFHIFNFKLTNLKNGTNNNVYS